MGNTTTSSKRDSTHKQHRHEPHKHTPNPKVVDAFYELSDRRDNITFTQFKTKFGAFIAPYLWRFLQDDSQASEMSLEQFSEHARSLTGMSTDVYVKIFGTAGALLTAAFEAAQISVNERDNAFIESLKADMMRKGDTVDDLARWKNMVCPRICHAIKNHVLDTFFNRKRCMSGLKLMAIQDVEIVASDILTPVEMFVLVNSLPVTVYFPHGTSEENLSKTKLWTKLYSSHYQGISINRFDTNVFQYRGSTIAIFQLIDGRVFVVACDEEWRHSLNKFGGPNTFLWQLRPAFHSLDLPERPIFCNFKLRSGTFGLNVGRHLAIDGEMANVADIEVWGCSGVTVLEEQQKMKQRARQQAERNAKVPLPGAWEENPDKNIMEMAGYQFSNEQKNDRPDDH